MTLQETLTITHLGQRGEGISRDGESTVFVPFTLPNEVVIAEVEQQRGRMVEIVKASSDRINAFCKYFGECGGCQLQHYATEPYLEYKRGLVVFALEKAGVTASVGQTIVAHGEGRRRATLHATREKAGFMGLRSHEIVDIDECPILTRGLKNIPEIAKAFANAIGPCDVSCTDTLEGVDVSITAKNTRISAKLTGICEKFGIARLVINGELVLNYRTPHILVGRGTVALPKNSFLQATAKAEDVLAEYAKQAAKGYKSIADLFCGVGPFALRLAEKAPVYAADSDRDAIAALDLAKRFAKGLKAISAEWRDLFKDPLSKYELNRFDCIIMDPPRAGALGQSKELAGANVKRVVYISCDPQSFARDAAVLIKGGYTMSEVTPVDQFAYSAHVEVMAVFDRA